MDAQAINLQSLKANHNKLNSLAGLAKCKKLKHLDLSHNCLTNTLGLEKVARTLETINLSNNEIGALEIPVSHCTCARASLSLSCARPRLRARTRGHPFSFAKHRFA